MGGYDYGPVDDDESRAAVRRALDLGVTLFDTADVYGFGHAEEVLRRALDRDRHDVVMATKFGVAWDETGRRRRDASRAWMKRALEGSLRRLQVDCIPLYQVHWPDGRTPWDETLDALEREQRAGKIRAIGLCNVGAAEIAGIQRRTRIETVQLPFGLLDRERVEDLAECGNLHHMGLLTYNSLGQGLLTGKYGPRSRFAGTDLRGRSERFRGSTMRASLAVADRVRKVGERRRKSPAQVAIRWVLETIPGSVVLTGIKQAAQAEDNAGAFGWNLGNDDHEWLSGSDAKARGTAET